MLPFLICFLVSSFVHCSRISPFWYCWIRCYPIPLKLTPESLKCWEPASEDDCVRIEQACHVAGCCDKDRSSQWRAPFLVRLCGRVSVLTCERVDDGPDDGRSMNGRVQRLQTTRVSLVIRNSQFGPGRGVKAATAEGSSWKSPSADQQPRGRQAGLGDRSRITRPAGGSPGWRLDRRAGRPYLNPERPGRAELGSAKPRELLTLFAAGSKKLIRAAGVYCRLANESMQANP